MTVHQLHAAHYAAVALAHAVATRLPDAWKAIAPPPGGTPALATSDGRRITVTVEAGRVTFTGQPPAGRYEPHPLTINVRVDRGEDVIAREVTRRLLGPYRARYDAAVAQAHQDAADEARAAAGRAAAVDVLSALVPPYQRRAQEDDRGATLRWSAGFDASDIGRGEVSVNRDGTEVRVLIEYLTPQAAARVLAALTREHP